jgi:hypothetical protein
VDDGFQLFGLEPQLGISIHSRKHIKLRFTKVTIRQHGERDDTGGSLRAIAWISSQWNFLLK